MSRKAGRARGRKRDPPLRYAITSAMVRTSMIGVFIRMAELKSWLGRQDPVSQTAIVTQSITVLEQFLRLILEEQLDREAGGPAYDAAKVRGEGKKVRVSRSRLRALRRGFQNIYAIDDMAAECNLPALKRRLAELWAEVIRALNLRHDLIHALGIIEIDAEGTVWIVGEIMEAALADMPKYRVLALLVEASIMEAAGRAGDARRAAERALEICRQVRAEDGKGGGDPWVLVCTGQSLARLRRMAEAEAAYREAAERHPRDVLSLVGMARLMVETDRPEEAVEWYKKAAAIDPSHVATLTGMGHVLAVVQGADGSLAVQRYQDAMRDGYEDVSLRTGYGTALAMLGRSAEAAEQYRMAIKMDPGDAAAYVGLGDALTALKRYAEAIEMYKKGIRAGAAAVSVHHIRLYGAEEDEEPISALGLGGAAAYRGWGNALLELGRNREAVTVLGRAVALDPGKVDAQAGLGRALYKLGRHDEAVIAYQNGIEIDSGSLDAQAGLGRALYKLGRYEEAAIAYRSALILDPSNVRAHAGLRRVLAQMEKRAWGRHY